ncbi:MAG: adenosine kinase, partial [Acidimicrobiaceae bacterium]|nr:adenosine kinase [Acidimicrobiaceae bacterium]
MLCVGTALVDHLAFVPDQLLEELGFVRGSMNLVDVATSERLRALVGEGRQVSGGSTANTAVGVASLGGSACFVGAVGDDVDGDRYASDLEQAGVEPILARLPVGPGEAATGRCIVAVSPDGERTM